MPENGGPGWVYWTCAPQNRKAEKYVFSALLKGSKNGLKVQMQAGFTGAEPKPVVVTDQWQRYDMIGILPAAANRHTMFRIILQSEGTLWIDGLQLEKGDKPTEFEE